MARALSPLGSCSHLLAHCRQLFPADVDSPADTRLLGVVSVCFCVALCSRRYHCQEHSNIETFCFIGMGLSVLVAFKPLIDSVSTAAVIWIIAEGVCYITGALFYSLHKKPFMHSVFHFFVLAGSLCHIIAVWDVLMEYL